MNPNRWQRLDELYGAAIGLPGDERDVFLDRECGGDAEMRAQVVALLTADARAQRFLEDPPTFSSLLERGGQGSCEIGNRIGPFELTEAVGEGGMGTVYKAIRVDDQYRVQVAIKVIKRGMDSESMLRRFRMERQILASLEHPNISRLLDGGATEDGRPYLVMEYVTGRTLIRYAEECGLSVALRIELFRTVCSAVQFAHQKLVVHRDLKPGNILVTDDGVPKLLDFGIAKLLEPDQTGETELTLNGFGAMTPNYASPEQVRGEMITTASDVYSLGVLLFELLTGERPLQLDSRNALDAVRIICEQDPPKASTAGPAARRKTLTGDLDTIVARALAKNPADRYGSAAHLSDDLRRYQEGLPIAARPHTIRYRAGKFASRHRSGVIFAVLLLAAIVAGIGATLWQARVASLQRNRAERRFNQVRSLANSFLFEFDDAIKNVEGTTAARSLIVKRALQYLGSLAGDSGDPELLREIATAYEKVSDVQGSFRMPNLGDPQGALAGARKAVAIRESLAAAAPGDPVRARELSASYRKTSDLLWLLEQQEEAFAFSRKHLAAAEIARRAAPADRETLEFLASAYSDHGRMLSLARHDEKGLGEMAGKAAVLLEPLVASDPQDLRARYLLAHAYGFQGAACLDGSPQALDLLRKALKMSQSLTALNPDNPTYNVATAGSYSELGSALQASGDLPGALENQRRAAVMFEQMAARDPLNAQVRRNLATLLCLVGELALEQEGTATAIPVLEKSLAVFEGMPVPHNIQTAWGLAKAQYVLGDAYRRQGQPQRSAALFRPSSQVLRDMRSRGVLPAVNAAFADQALAAMAGFLEKM